MANTGKSIYFALVGDYVKIGVSTDVRRRLYGLGSRSLVHPDDLDVGAPRTLIGTIPGGYALESDIHADLWEWQAVGEWFEATPFVLAHIDALLTASGEVAAA